MPITKEQLAVLSEEAMASAKRGRERFNIDGTPEQNTEELIKVCSDALDILGQLSGAVLQTMKAGERIASFSDGMRFIDHLMYMETLVDVDPESRLLGLAAYLSGTIDLYRSEYKQALSDAVSGANIQMGVEDAADRPQSRV